MSKIKFKEIALGAGKLITAHDSATIGTNYQTLKNLRPEKNSLKAVHGMSKINSATALTKPKVRGAFHYKKSFPSVETHILAQCWNSGETAFDLLGNTNAVPGTGDFSATALLSDADTAASGAGKGRFSYAPNGQMAYCDGVNAMLWAGNEAKISKIINIHPSNTFRYDYTEQLTNSKNDANNRATLYDGGAGISSSTMLLLHGDNNVTDSSPTTPHTVTNNNVTFDATNKVFGTHALNFNGTTAYLTIPDDADFNFSGGIGTREFRVRCEDLAKGMIYYQQTDANNYEKMWVDSNGAVNWSIFATGAEVLSTGFKTPNSVIAINTFYHIAFVENGDNYYIFVNGVQQAYLSDASRAANYTGLVQLGYDGTTYFDGQLDEVGVFNTAKWIANFTVPISAYGADNIIYLDIGVTRPVKGFKFYVQTSLGVTSSPLFYYWSGSAWTSVGAITDGSASGGITLAQTGTMSFTSTVSVAKPRVLHDECLYWYKMEINATTYLDVGIIYQVTADMSFQAIKDLWDGEFRVCEKVFSVLSSAYTEYTTNVYKDENIVYDPSNPATYLGLNSLTDQYYLLLGFTEQMMGIKITMGTQSNDKNTNACVASLYYSSDGGTFTQPITVDETSVGGKSLNRDGIISWTAPSTTAEFQHSIEGSAPFYYYKIQWNATLDAQVRVIQIQGITAPKNITGYKFPFFADNALFLCSDTYGEKHKVLRCNTFMPDVWNGEDAIELLFGNGEELMGACSLYSRLGGNIYDLKLFFTVSQIFGLSGTDIENYKTYNISLKIGCVSGNTLKITTIVTESGSIPVAIWEAMDGIYVFDNTTPRRIDGDIKNFFDKNESNTRKIHASYRSLSYGEIDEINRTYHWHFADGSSTGTLNREFVCKLDEGFKWYEIDRGTGKYIQCHIGVIDTNSNNYNYGFIDTGYMERLENGTDFDGNAIACTVQTGDFVSNQEGSIWVNSQLTAFRLVAKGETTSTNNYAITHYGDGNSSGTSLTAVDVTPVTNHRIIQSYEDLNIGDSSVRADAIFHSLKFTKTADDSTRSELLFLALQFNEIDVDKEAR